MIILTNFWNLVLESAPWLLLGYFLAGVIKQIVPSSWVEGQLATSGYGAIVKGAFIGAPLPLCSCGVIPTALAIRKAGASKSATSSFLVATPETGVDSISFSYAVLGPVFAIARPIAAVVSAIVTGVLVKFMDTDTSMASQMATESSCCSAAPNSCPSTQEETKPRLSEKIVAAVKYGYGNMIADTAKWLVIGLVGAALITTWVPQSFFTQWGDGLMAMLVMVIVGMPMYICATASTPVAASLLFAGVSPGAALVFMLTGPATNIATMGVIKEQLGNRSLLAYLIGVIASAMICGLVLNQLFQVYSWSPLPLMSMEHEGFALWRQLAALILTALVLRVAWQARPQQWSWQHPADEVSERARS